MSETPAPYDLGRDRLSQLMDDAEKTAWEALAHYRFMEFAFQAELWASLHKLSGLRKKSPFGSVARVATRRDRA